MDEDDNVIMLLVNQQGISLIFDSGGCPLWLPQTSLDASAAAVIGILSGMMMKTASELRSCLCCTVFLMVEGMLSLLVLSRPNITANAVVGTVGKVGLLAEG